ncbi:MAG: hypothetical protein P8L85_07055 [Rubripirellula sp.]|nr:hypothetical protein [Rubripirellula sp.]
MANVTDESAPQFENATQKSGSKGCLYGCLAVIVGGLLLAVCAGVGTWWFVKGQIEKYTSAEPREIAKVEYSEEQMAELQARVDVLLKPAEDDEPLQGELVLTAEEINALITASDDMSGKVFITIENDEITGDISIPLDGVPGASGRYFNGSAGLSVSMQNGKLFVSLVDAELKGEPLPAEFVDAMAAENLAKNAYSDPDAKKVLDKLEDVRVDGDKLILSFKQADESEEGEAGDTEAEADASEEGASEEGASEADAKSEATE